MSERRMVKKTECHTKYVYLSGLPLSDYIEHLLELGEQLVAEHGEGTVMFETEYDGGSRIDLIVTKSREETDKEYRRRMKAAATKKKRDAEKAAALAAKELAEFERLAKKYGDRANAPS